MSSSEISGNTGGVASDRGFGEVYRRDWPGEWGREPDSDIVAAQRAADATYGTAEETMRDRAEPQTAPVSAIKPSTQPPSGRSASPPAQSVNETAQTPRDNGEPEARPASGAAAEHGQAVIPGEPADHRKEVAKVAPDTSASHETRVPGGGKVAAEALTALEPAAQKAGLTTLGGHADVTALGALQVMDRTKPEAPDRPSDPDAQRSLESGRGSNNLGERLMQDPGLFTQLVEEEVRQPTGFAEEVVKAQPAAQQVRDTITRCQTAVEQGGTQAFWDGATGWTKDEIAAAGFTKKDLQRHALEVGKLQRSFDHHLAGDPHTDVRVSQSGARVGPGEAFASLRTHAKQMDYDYGQRVRPASPEDVILGRQERVHAPGTQERLTMIVAAEQGYVRLREGVAAADKLPSDEIISIAIGYARHADLHAATSDGEAWNRGERPTEVGPKTRSVKAIKANLDMDAAKDSAQAAGVLAAAVAEITGIEEKLSDRVTVDGQATMISGRLEPMSDESLRHRIQWVATQYNYLLQAQGAQAAYEFLAAQRLQVVGRLDGAARARQSRENPDSTVAGSGIYTSEELLVMGEDQVAELGGAVGKIISESASETGARNVLASEHFAELVEMGAVFFTADATGLQIERSRLFEKLAQQRMPKLFPAAGRHLVITGNTHPSDGPPNLLLMAIAASKRAAVLDTLGLTSPTGDRLARHRLERLSDGQTIVNQPLAFLEPGRQWERIGIEGQPSEGMINPRDPEAALLDHLAPGGLCHMTINMNDLLTQNIMRAIDPEVFAEAIPQGSVQSKYYHQMRWLLAPTTPIRVVGHSQNQRHALRFGFGHVAPHQPEAEFTLFLLPNTKTGGINPSWPTLLGYMKLIGELQDCEYSRW